MKRSRKQILALLAALALVLAMLSACGGSQQPGGPAPADEPAATQPEDVPDAVQPASDPEPADQPEPEEIQPEDPKPAGEQPEETESPEEQPAQPVSAPAEPDPEPEAEPEPEADPEPAPEPAEPIPEDGTYTVSVTLEGGSGRASVESPAVLRCEDGKFYATVVWSSSNYDYMKVDGQRYDPINTEGNSTFEIPVSAFDQPLAVIADTIAMSEPHEVEYTLTFDSASMQDA